MYNNNKKKKLNIFINNFYTYIINFINTIKLIKMKVKKNFFFQKLLFNYLLLKEYFIFKENLIHIFNYLIIS